MKTSFTHSFSPLYPLNDSATIITHHARNLTPAPFSRHGDNKKQSPPPHAHATMPHREGTDDRHHHAIAQSGHRPRKNAGF
ncbi:hypothetical protein AOY77_14485 [Escherichia coli]|nr:hypothetical protein [Escherichia coli]EEY6168356.1 hypothetical protein [Escherichia coli]EFA4710761.1 hypothetical protein [Escherichia coli]EFD0859980.1 hypothetical protein [Escherichia coli]EFD0922445.1 hypothetical protein [Escherichia coli]